LTARFHGVFALNSAHRAVVAPSKRGTGKQASLTDRFGALMVSAQLWKALKNRADVQKSSRLSGAIWANTASKHKLSTA
jgi:hypothetical protein